MEDAQQLFRQDVLTVTDREAFVGLAVCAITSDGRVDAEEVRGLPRHLSRLRMYAEADLRDLEALVGRVSALGQERGLDRLLSACARAVPEKLRDSAFAFCVDVVLSDRELGIQEQVFLERLRHRLNVESNTATMIQNVARIRHLA